MNNKLEKSNSSYYDDGLDIARPTNSNIPKASSASVSQEDISKLFSRNETKETYPTEEQIEMARQANKSTEKGSKEEPEDEPENEEKLSYTEEELDRAIEEIKSTEKDRPTIIVEPSKEPEFFMPEPITIRPPVKKPTQSAKRTTAKKTSQSVKKSTQFASEPVKKKAETNPRETGKNIANAKKETTSRKENISKIKSKGHVLGRWFYGTRFGQWWQDLDTKQFSSNLRADQIEERREEIKEQRERLGIKTKSEKKNATKISGETSGESPYEDYKNSIIGAFINSELSQADPSIGRQFRRLFNMPTDEMKMDDGDDGYFCNYQKLLSEIKKNDISGAKSSLAYLLRELKK